MQTLYRDIPTALESCKGTSLSALIQKAQFLLTLDHYTQTILPDTLKSYCRVMNVQNGVLVLGISSAAIATSLKMTTSDLLAQIQREKRFERIKDIKFTIQPKIAHLT